MEKNKNIIAFILFTVFVLFSLFHFYYFGWEIVDKKSIDTGYFPIAFTIAEIILFSGFFFITSNRENVFALKS